MELGSRLSVKLVPACGNKAEFGIYDTHGTKGKLDGRRSLQESIAFHPHITRNFLDALLCSSEVMTLSF